MEKHKKETVTGTHETLVRIIDAHEVDFTSFNQETSKVRLVIYLRVESLGVALQWIGREDPEVGEAYDQNEVNLHNNTEVKENISGADTEQIVRALILIQSLVQSELDSSLFSRLQAAIRSEEGWDSVKGMFAKWDSEKGMFVYPKYEEWTEVVKAL